MRNPAVDDLAAAMDDAGVSIGGEAQAEEDRQFEELLAQLSPEDDEESEGGTNPSEEEPTGRAEPSGERKEAGSGRGPEGGDQGPQDHADGARPKEGGQREATAAELRSQFEEFLARLQREPEKPGEGETAKKAPNPTKKRKVPADEEVQVHREVIFRHIIGNENTTGTPESPTRNGSSTTSTGTPKRTPGSTPGENGMTGGRGGHGHGQIPVSWQERLCRNITPLITVRAVDGTGASTSGSTTSTPRARPCPECEYSTPREDNLRRHILSVHTEGESARRIRESARRMLQMRQDMKSKTPKGTKKDKKEQK